MVAYTGIAPVRSLPTGACAGLSTSLVRRDLAAITHLPIGLKFKF